MELHSIDILDAELALALKYSERDRMWIDNLTAFYHSELKTTLSDERVIEGYLFKEFRGYYISLLKTFEGSLLSCTKDLTSSTSSGTEVLMKDYGLLWFRAWTRSHGFQAWNSQQVFCGQQTGRKIREAFYSDWPSPIIFPGEEGPENEEDFEDDPDDIGFDLDLDLDLDPEGDLDTGGMHFGAGFNGALDGLTETELAIQDAIRSPMVESQPFETGRLEDYGPPYHPGYRRIVMKRVPKAKHRKGMARKFIGSVSSYLWKKKKVSQTEHDQSITVDVQEIQVKVKALEQPVADSRLERSETESQVSSDSEGLEKRTRLLRSRLSSSWQHPILSHQPLLASYKNWNYWPARPRPANMEGKSYGERDGGK